MRTVYLDTNILSCVHEPPAGAKWRENADELLAFADASLATFVYSDAHLMDLRQGYWKKQDLALEKLKLLSQLTRNSQIITEGSTAKIASADLMTVFNRETEELTHWLGPGRKRVSLLPLLRAIPTFQKLRSIPVNLSDVEGAFAHLPIRLDRTRKKPTAYNLAADLLDFIADMLADGFPYYKTARKYTIKETSISGTIAGLEDPLAGIEILLRKQRFGRHILSAIDDVISEDGNDLGQIMGCRYISLDYLGYAKDDMNKRKGFGNLATDARHCFYAQHCDILVTDDQKFHRKASAMYRNMRINTVILSSDAFLELTKAPEYWTNSKHEHDHDGC